MANQNSTIVQQKWTGRAILLVDLDAFFASVEQLHHPEWRGKPVIVGGSAQHRGVVSTCSYEARAYGVRSAMPSAIAKRLCPNAIWAHPHFDQYRELSRAVMSILYDESPLLEQVSIDEAFLDASPGRYTGEDPVRIASRIQERVAELGITCSIGVASGKAVAKIASDMDKPCGLTVVYPGSEAAFLAPMEVRAMPGIGKQGAAKLSDAGIRTLGDLAGAPPELIQPILGVNSQALQNRARGIDTREIQTTRETKSVGHERTFSVDISTRQDIEDAIDMLGSMVGLRLRRKGLAGKTVMLKLRFADLSIRTAQRSLPHQMDNEALFIPVAKELIDEIWRDGMSVRLVGVSISGFEEPDRQLDLFEDEQSQHINSRIVETADKVRDKFGDDALRFGREIKLKAKDTGTPSR